MAGIAGAQVRPPADSAVTTILRRSDARLIDARVWKRIPLTDDLDLVLAMATPATFQFDSADAQQFWGTQRRLGIFLQERSAAGRVYTLTVADGPDECFMRLLRATVTDTVIACEQEKSEVGPTQKFVYDVRAKRLVSHFTYDPFITYALERTRSGGVWFSTASDEQRTPLIVDFAAARTPQFRLLASAPKPEPLWNLPSTPAPPPFINVSPPFGPSRNFRLVVPTDCSDYHRVIRETLKSGERLHRIPDDACDRIGPWHLEGDRLWFGKTFYAGEGATGTGGFGFFDARTARFTVYSPAELKEWSVAAIHATPDAVWLALHNRGEYGDSSGGILRFDRQTHVFSRIKTELVGSAFAQVGQRLFLAGDWGILEIEADRVVLRFVDRTTDGRLRLAEGTI